MTNEDNKRKNLDIPDVTTTFQSVALLEANDQAQVQDDETQKGCDDGDNYYVQWILVDCHDMTTPYLWG